MSPVIIPESGSSVWSPVTFYWKNSLSSMTLTASSEASGYEVENIFDMRESSLWKAAGSSDQNIQSDAGVGHSYIADYLAIANHNLRTSGGTIVLQYSANGSAWTNAFTPFIPESDDPIIVEFNSANARFWRILITTLSEAPFMGICIWGAKSVLGYVWGKFDPNQQEVKDTAFISDFGYLMGISRKYVERILTLKLDRTPPDVYAELQSWADACGIGNFFVAWEKTAHAADAYLMHWDGKFNNPMTDPTGTYRSVTINLKGRRDVAGRVYI